MPIGPGTLLKDNIELVRVLGEGGMGVVWVGRNRSLDSEVAVKVLHTHADSEPLRERFAQEARSVARIDSPHVVKIFDFGTTEDGEPFFVMEMLRGKELHAHLEEHGAMSPADTATLLRQLCRALGRAHELGVVHRDIKPANIFLAESHGDIFAKVLDFGVAKQLGQGDLGLTTTGAMMGTPYYMSPEQFISPRAVDHRTDLWSAAVVVYACLLGQLPFVGETIGALSLAVHKGDFDPPSRVDQTLPPAIDPWFARALDPDPGRRFQSALELAESFQQAILSDQLTKTVALPSEEPAPTSVPLSHEPRSSAPLDSTTPASVSAFELPAARSTAQPVSQPAARSDGPAAVIFAPSTLHSEPAGARALHEQPATLEGAAHTVASAPARGRSTVVLAVSFAIAMVAVLVVVLFTRGGGSGSSQQPAPAACSEVTASAPSSSMGASSSPSGAVSPSAEPMADAGAATPTATPVAKPAPPPPAFPKTAKTAPPAVPPTSPPKATAGGSQPSNCYVMVNGKLTIKPECL